MVMEGSTGNSNSSGDGEGWAVWSSQLSRRTLAVDRGRELLNASRRDCRVMVEGRRRNGRAVCGVSIDGDGRGDIKSSCISSVWTWRRTYEY